MKLLRLALVFMFIFVAIGCASQQTKESEFWDHPAVYKSWDHFKFSFSGYKNPTPAMAEKSKDQGWWGMPVDVPAK